MSTTILPVYLNFIHLGILMLAIDVRFRFTNVIFPKIKTAAFVAAALRSVSICCGRSRNNSQFNVSAVLCAATICRKTGTQYRFELLRFQPTAVENTCARLVKENRIG